MINNTLEETFKGKRVLVTGHTGFKGSWLSIWLEELGAKVYGFSAEAPTDINNFELSNLDFKINDIEGDIKNMDFLAKQFMEIRPDVVFHLAAQAIVLKGYEDPADTFETNVMGTVNVLDLIRHNDFVKAGIFVTSDKCYENKDLTNHEFEEGERMGGHDPYSASKGMAEIAISSYLRSYFKTRAIASVRAGNVIGGGDFAENRIVPDCMRYLMQNKSILLRNPYAIRPWQFVLESLGGYLTIAANLLSKNGVEYNGGWNFGPSKNENCSVEKLTGKIIKLWGSGNYTIGPEVNKPKEASYLALNCKKAKEKLGWQSVYPIEKTLEETVKWYKHFAENDNDEDFNFYDFNVQQIRDYSKQARENGMSWF